MKKLLDDLGRSPGPMFSFFIGVPCIGLRPLGSQSGLVRAIIAKSKVPSAGHPV
jgi:hypothetical protein